MVLSFFVAKFDFVVASIVYLRPNEYRARILSFKLYNKFSGTF